MKSDGLKIECPECGAEFDCRETVTEESARLELCKIGLCPIHHNTLKKAVEGAQSVVKTLRRDLHNPPADLIEKVLADYRKEGFTLQPMENDVDQSAP